MEDSKSKNSQTTNAGRGLGMVFQESGLKTQTRLDPFPQGLTCQRCIPTKCSQFFCCGSDFSWSLLHSPEKIVHFSKISDLLKISHFSKTFSKFSQNLSQKESQKFSKISQNDQTCAFLQLEANFRFFSKIIVAKNSQTFSKIFWPDFSHYFSQIWGQDGSFG